MYIKTLLCATALSAGVANADFMVYTEPPIPTSAIPSFPNSASASAWTTSVYLNARLAWNAYTSARGSTYDASVSSAASEVRAFASTASNYSIPADVTDDNAMTTFFSAPNWYSALPTGARQFKEEQVSDQFSIIRSIIGDDATAGASGATGTGSPGAAAMPTPRAGLGVGFGAMAAVAAGVFL
ncbi:hypothetical protein N0V90_010779 [Kalmusia sp. IMI 367209]|nr:hypothetical protein N0V90_010779 [Kalmusia sp. IMI 367209]